MLNKTTKVFANHGMPLECDIYADDQPGVNTTPVFLYFHPGGLVAYGRTCVPPWLVQICYQRKWPLISASYRLLPQTGSQGLLDDVRAAYEFAQRWGAREGQPRPVIVGGSSAGGFLSMLAGHHLHPTPLALLSLEGINTFHHSFFNSSTLLLDEPIADEDVAHLIAGPVMVGVTPETDEDHFDLGKLHADGSKNTDFKPASQQSHAEEKTGKYSQGDLYDYYVYKNGYLDLVGDIDPGFKWGQDPAQKTRLEKWPATIIIHGTGDTDVPFSVSEQMVEQLGAGKVELVVVDGQRHLFTQRLYIDDESPEVEATRKVVARLDSLAAK